MTTLADTLSNIIFAFDNYRGLSIKRKIYIFRIDYVLITWNKNMKN